MKRDYDNSVVTGRSILSSSAKILNASVTNCSYLEFRTFCDFLECLILHNNLYIVGNFNDRENPAIELMKNLNSRNGKDFIFIVDDTQDKLEIDSISIDTRIKEILINTFGNELSFVRKQIIPENYTYRYTDDEKTNFLNDVSSLCIENNKNIFIKIKSLVIEKFRNDRNSEFIKHLLRAFAISAFATMIKGTVRFTGSRKPLGALIILKNKIFKFETTSFSIYKYANSLFMNYQKELVLSNQIAFYHPLMLSIFLNKLKNKTDSLDTIINLRKEFESFRKVNSKISVNLNLASSRLKYSKFRKNTKKYLNEIYRFASDNNFLNLLRKYYKEILLDEPNIKLDFDFNESEDDKNAGTSTSINLAKIIKNIIKFNVDFFKNRKIKKKTSPLSKYFAELINSKFITFESKLINIKEFQTKKMKVFDQFVKNFNL